MDQTDDVPAGGVSEIIVEQIITRDRLDAAVGAVVGERRRQPRIVEARQIPKVDMGVDEGNLRHSTLSHFRPEEHTSELQSLMRIPYTVFCFKTNTTIHKNQ